MATKNSLIPSGLTFKFDDYVEGQLNNTVIFLADNNAAHTILEALCAFYSGDSVSIIHQGKTIHGEAGSQSLDAALDRLTRP